MESDAKARRFARLAEKMEREGKVLPYRWGYFQGVVLIPWSLFLILAYTLDLRKLHSDDWYTSVIGLVIGLVGIPLGFGLLWKRTFALVLVYVVFGLTLLLLAIKMPIAIAHYRDAGDKGSAIGEAEMLLVWLGSMIYYRRRRAQFR
jgi:hypothetical protein